MHLNFLLHHDSQSFTIANHGVTIVDRAVTIANPLSIVQRLKITIANQSRLPIMVITIANRAGKSRLPMKMSVNQLPWPHAKLERCVLAPVAGFMTKCDA